MAIDDNMSYELTGSQVKDLATRIKGNTKLAKDLVGGAPRVSKRINVFQLTDYDEATEISNQIDNPDVYPALLIQQLKYAFYDVFWGKYLNRYEIGEAIDGNRDFVYFSTTGGDGFVQKIIVRANANYDEDTDTYSPSFLIYEINTKTPYGGGKMHELSLNENTETGLEDWYTADLSTWEHEPAYVIQRMTTTEAQEIANKINADNPGVAVTSSDVSSYMKFVCRNTATGKMIQTASAFRQALYRGSNDVYFLPSMAGADANLEAMVFKGGNTRAAGFNLMNMWTSAITSYNIANPSSFYGTNAEYMWYIAERDDVHTIQLPYGYPDDTAIDVSTDTPEAVFQTAVDANGNLYMASGNTAASDWKQINNTEGSVVTYYMDNGTTQGIPSYNTYIYSDAARTVIASPDAILGDYEAGNIVFLKYKSTQTGSSAYDMTLQVNSMALVGADGYKMLVGELNTDNGNYNAVNTVIQATWDGTGTFSSRWVLARNVVPIVNLYTTTGQNTDGAVTQKLFTDTVGNIETILQTLNTGTGV